MAVFKQDFTITQSADCTTLTLADNSNFSSNDQGYTFSTFTTKNIIIYDNASTILATLPIVDATPVTYTVTSDMYYSIVYTLQIGTSTPLTKIYNVALTCFVNLAYGTLVAKDSECASSVSNNERLFNIVKGISSSQIFASRGNGALAQDMLDYANAYANDCLGDLSSGSDCGCSK